MTRNATARWEGTGKEGKGILNGTSGVFTDAPYTFATRFENGKGTNPEELLAAAHAGCFSMKLAFDLNAAGITADSIETTCGITLDGSAITTSALKTTVSAPGLTEDKLHELAQNAKAECPVSKLYNCNITLEATLG